MNFSNTSELQVFVNGLALKSYTVNDDGDWVFEGLASTHDVDLVGEVIYPESFINSIEFFKSNGKIFFDHEYAKKPDEWLEKFGFSKDEILSLKTPIGKPIDASLTSDGLMIKGVLNKEHPIAKKMWVEFLDNPDANFRDQIGLSIGAKYMGTPRKEYDVRKGKYVTILPDLLLYEVSMTPVPVNPHTWTSAVKSLTSLLDNDIEHHTIVPETLEFDESSQELVIKSVVGSDDGTTHVMENRLNKEDILKLMPKDKITTKAVGDEVKEQEEETVATQPEAAEPSPTETTPPALDVTEDIVDDVVPGVADEAPEVGGDPLADAGGDIVPPMGGAEDPMAGGDEGSFLDSLAGEAEDPLAPTEDAATELLLDKQDIMLELLTEIKDSLVGDTIEEALPMDSQITDSITTKSVAEVSLSEESTQEFTTALKSVFDDFEDRIVAKVIAGLSNIEVRKSVEAPAKEGKVIRQPGTVAVHAQPDVDSNTVIKSIQPDLNIDSDREEMDKAVLKSFVDEYRNVRGHNTTAIQARAKVVDKACKQLSLEDFEFKYYVGLADKGRL